MMNKKEKEEYIKQLHYISREVRTWPYWKRSALGYIVIYDFIWRGDGI